MILGHKQSALLLLTCVMLAQSIPISYHREANGCIFFNEDVVCIVLQKLTWARTRNIFWDDDLAL